MLIFRKAVHCDIPFIVQIADSYYNQLSSNGFIVKLPNEQILISFMSSNVKELFVACNMEGVILGYLMVDAITNDTKSGKSDYSFFRKEDEKLLLNPSIGYIHQVAVHKDYKNLHIGSFLYEQLFRMYPEKHFILSVVTGPIKNEASYRFHLKHGFSIIAIFQSDFYRGFKNYESVMFYK